MRASWLPLQKFAQSLVPQTAGQAGLFLLGLCFCWAPLLYVSSGLLLLGLGGWLIGWTLWVVAALTRAALAVYLRHLIPW